MEEDILEEKLDRIIELLEKITLNTNTIGDIGTSLSYLEGDVKEINEKLRRT